MTVWLLNDRPEHPVMRQVLELIGRQREVTAVDPTVEGDLERARRQLATAPPSVVLVKSHDPAALQFARQARQAGVVVVNDPDAAARSLDRRLMAIVAGAAEIAFPATSQPFSLAVGSEGARAVETAFDEVGVGDGGVALVKSRYSRRSDLVARVARRDLVELAGGWDGEEVVVQPIAVFDGVDHKVWAVGRRLFAVRRSSPIPGLAGPVHSTQGGAPGPVEGDVPTELPPDWADLVHATGLAFGLTVYGVDLVATSAGPLVVDVNPFPGCRGGVGAAEAIAALALARLPAGPPTDVRD